MLRQNIAITVYVFPSRLRGQLYSSLYLLKQFLPYTRYPVNVERRKEGKNKRKKEIKMWWVRNGWLFMHALFNFSIKVFTFLRLRLKKLETWLVTVWGMDLNVEAGWQFRGYFNSSDSVWPNQGLAKKPKALLSDTWCCLLHNCELYTLRQKG